MFRKAVFAGTLFTGIWLLNSCEEKPTSFGSEIFPGSDHLSVFSSDTFRVISHTDYVYPTNTQSTYRPYIGCYNDHYLGTTTSGFVSQLRLWPEWPGGNTWLVDSVKLFMRITSHYGTNNNAKYLRISEISNTLHRNATYYSDTPVDTTGFGVSASIPALRTDTTVNDIVINLPNSFGQHLIRDASKLFHAADTADIDFSDYFKGIYITIPPATAADPFLIGLDVTYDSRNVTYHNYIVVYMHAKEAPDTKTSQSFVLDSKIGNARFSKVKHEFNGTYKVGEQTTDSVSYTQGIYGAFTKVSIPGLEAIKNDPARARLSVNIARLTAPAQFDNYVYTDKTVARKLLARYTNEAGNKVLVPDYYVGDVQNYFSGTFDTVKYEYQLNLANFVQNYLEDTQNKLKPEFEIFVPADDASNAILKANNSKTPPKFELTLIRF